MQRVALLIVLCLIAACEPGQVTSTDAGAFDGGPAGCFPNPCRNSGTCSVTEGEITCSCAPGFEGERCDSQQQQITSWT